MKSMLSLILIGMMLVSTGCITPGTTAKGTLTGAVIGAGAGAIIGKQSGDAGEGAVIGAGLGALTGGLIGSAIEKSRKLKICPVDGEAFDVDVKYCPTHGTELKYK